MRSSYQVARDQVSEPLYCNFRASRFSNSSSHNAGGKNAGGKESHSKLGACTEMLLFPMVSKICQAVRVVTMRMVRKMRVVTMRVVRKCAGGKSWARAQKCTFSNHFHCFPIKYLEMRVIRIGGHTEMHVFPTFLKVFRKCGW